ncbi:hypothetical protein ACJMK2_042644 [Sinanodonta woodiana]|uniref:Uncharacterized protein n=1 Tax=Sinanodonta woodiana TaxID=1069815 RepID=A0ABD3W821_SINWO
MDILSEKESSVCTRSMLKRLDDERTVENTDQGEDEDKNKVVNNIIETANTDQRHDVGIDKHSAINADIMSKLQNKDISLKVLERSLLLLV